MALFDFYLVMIVSSSTTLCNVSELLAKYETE